MCQVRLLSNWNSLSEQRDRYQIILRIKFLLWTSHKDALSSFQSMALTWNLPQTILICFRYDKTLHFRIYYFRHWWKIVIRRLISTIGIWFRKSNGLWNIQCWALFGFTSEKAWILWASWVASILCEFTWLRINQNKRFN
jgi:hypothetical protein